MRWNDGTRIAVTTRRWLIVTVLASLILATLYIVAWRQAHGLNP